MTEYFKITFKDFINSYEFKNKIDSTGIDYSDYIWICWWQGIDNAPEIVKTCINSIQRNAENHKVIIITEANYKNYVNFPEWIIKKYNEGIITRTNLSDLLRISLLAEHGGMWLDATFYCINSLDKYFKCPLWTIKRPNYRHSSVACGFFAGYSLYCNYENRYIFSCIRDYFLNYWKNNNMLIDYLLIDYMINLVVGSYPIINEQFTNIENNNKNCDELCKLLNEPFDRKIWENIKTDTCLFKLTWKSNFLKKTQDGRDTFYSRLISNKL